MTPEELARQVMDDVMLSYTQGDIDSVAAAIREAVEAKRRACVEVARNYDSPYCTDPEMGVASSTAEAIARIIDELE